MSPGISGFAAAAAVIAVGAVLQAATGMGTGIMVVPLLALIDLDFVPGAAVLASMALSVPMAWRGRRHIAYPDIGPLLGGLMVGVVAGALGLASIPAERVGIAFAVIILATVMVTSIGMRIAFNRRNLFTAGAIAGLMGATSGIGAPPIALLYQHREGPELRPTLAFVYAASSAMILVLLAIVGRFGRHEALLAVFLVPGYLVGFLIATPLARILDQGYSRLAVLLISTASAIILLIRSW